MKRKLSLLLVLSSFIATLCSGQGYQSVFGKDSSQWNVLYLIPDYLPTFLFKSNGDTVIGENKYRKLYSGYYHGSYKHYGFIREDTLLGRLWFRSLENKEQLIMDLSLAKADTFAFSEREKYTVDTIFYISKQKHIGFVTHGRDSIFFVEGVGPSNFMYNYNTYNSYNALLRCKFSDGQLTYHYQKHGFSPNCVDTFTSVSNHSTLRALIYPNPATHYIRLNIGSTESYHTIEVYSLTGQLVLQKKYIRNEAIYIGNLRKGFYYAVLRSKLKAVGTKFLKQ